MQSKRRPRFVISRLNATQVDRRALRPQRCEFASSLAVLAAAGALVCAAPEQARAQAAGTVLPRGTVPVLRGVVAGQATVGAPTSTSTGQLLTITQQSTRAIIDWEKFNIANGSEVRFIQPSTVASVLNRIYSLDPTIIQGKLTANGQVLLINQNGILFDRGAQINVNSLVASALNIGNDTFNKGLTAGANSAPAFEGGYQLNGNGQTDPALKVTGAIRIGAYGDPATALPTIAANPGGNIMVFAPVIENRNGLITSPDGQVVLAAGSKAYLSDLGADGQGVRGVLVEVSADDGPVDLTSLIRNQGVISADRGNITLAGLAINQAGRVSASTAVLYDGSIWLKARSVKPGDAGGVVPARSGAVELAAGSITETPLDTSDKTRISEGTDYASADLAKDRRGSIRIEGGTIAQRGTVTAPGGRIDITASDTEVPGNAHLYLDEGSVTSAAGDWADVDYASNLLTFKVTSNELKDSPLQKNGVLKGQTVTVDLRKGSGILDLSGYLDARLRGVAEKAAVGGDITLSSTGSLAQRRGAVVDVSGGGYVYGDGRVVTSQLLGTDGKNYDIGSASKDRTYTALLDSYTQTFDRWGQSVVYSGLNVAPALTEAGYLEGQRGGNLTISAPQGMVLDGTLRGGATTGPNQLANAPRGGMLVIGTNLNLPETVPVANVVFTDRATSSLRAGFDVDSTLDDELANQLTLSAQTLFPAAAAAQAGAAIGPSTFDSVEINSRGSITLPAGVALRPGVDATLTLRGQQIDIGGTIAAPSGSVALQTRTLVGSEATPKPGRITLQAGASISTAGLWLNNASRDGTPVGAVLPSATTTAGGTPTSALNGGSISLSSESVDLQPGSVLDVSGGGRVARNNAVTGGNAGSISVSADAGQGVLADNRFGAELRGYALGSGGSLTIALGQLQIGGGAAPDEAYRFDNTLFEQGGFRSYDLAGARGLKVMEDARIEPVVESWQVDPLAAAALGSGGDLASIARRAVLPEDERSATSVSLRAKGSGNASIEVQKGAAIAVAAGGSIALDAIDGIAVDGTLQAPGGNITLTLNGRANQAASELHLGENARLLADAAFIADPNDLGLRQGRLLAGGSVSLNTTRSTIATDAHSLISVDGLSRTLDQATTDPARPYAAVQANADAGTVAIRAQDEVHLNGSMSGRAPGLQSAGGSFALDLTNREDDLNPENTGRARRIVVTQAPADIAPAADTVDAVLDINALRSGGFDKLRLAAQDQLELRGRIDMEFQRGVRLDAPELRVAGDGRVAISGASVVLANSFGQAAPGGIARENGAPSVLVGTIAGRGTLEVDADTIDLYGDLTVNGVGQTTLTSQNDVRLSGRGVGSALTSPAGATLTGSLTSTGDVTINAAQLYPTTQSQFTLAVAERAAGATETSVVTDGAIVVNGNGRDQGTVYSAGGKIVLQADHIQQAGTVRAPLGEIALDATSTLELAPGSLTSVSADGATIPYGSTVAGVKWLYATTNGTVGVNDLKAAPAKRIVLTGASIDQRSGSTVDVSGGGDLLATEFVPGSGGTSDVLLKDNTYAIIPAAQLAAMPVDSDIAKLKDPGFGAYSAAQDRAVYDSIHIGSGAVVPEGDYVLLPGRYALLPGAYMVQLQTGSAYAAMTGGTTQALTNGQTVVAGYRTAAGTGIRESRSVGVVVRPGSEARTESDYNLSGAQFFADLATRERRSVGALPGDAGAISIAAIDRLQLAGSFDTRPASAQARAAEVDISAERIALVDHVGQSGIDANYLQVEAGTLAKINGSVLIGGTRSDDGEAVKIAAGASSVIVANSSAQPLAVPEILIAASDRIEVRDGSVLAGTGTIVGRVRDIGADAGGALIRLSNAEQVAVDRGASPDTTHGSVEIQASATLRADKAMLIDATRSTTSKGDLQIAAGGALSLAAGSIGLGDAAAGASGTDAPAPGLVLSNAQLARFNTLDALALKSYGSIDLIGAVQVGSSALKNLTLDTALLQGVPGAASDATAQIRAGSVTLLNSGATETSAATGDATLNIAVDRILIGDGAKAIGGYAALNIDATGDVVGSGAGSLRVAGDLNLRSARIVSEAGAKQAWQAVDDSVPEAPVQHQVRLAANPLVAGAAAAAAPTALGSTLSIEGRAIESGAHITMNSGGVALTALGSGANDGVRLSDGAVIDVRGSARDFNGAIATADAGSVALGARSGDVGVDAGAAIRLDAAAQGGAAGRLDLTARSVRLDGALSAGAAAGEAGGRVKLDVQTLADFSALNNRLNTSGFNEARDLRVRQGDVVVAAGDTVTARHIALAADAGRIAIDGTLDAGSVQGQGSVEVYAQNGLTVGDNALIDASGRGTGTTPSNGGQVLLDTRAGTLTFNAGGRIDVRAGEQGTAGQVVFTAARNVGNDAVAADLRGTVLSRRHAGDAAAEVAVEARRVYTAGDTGDIAAYETDHVDFMTRVDSAAIKAGIRGDDGAPQGNVHVRGAVEVQADGDFATSGDWALTPPAGSSGGWLAGGEPGTLTIRATGDLIVGHALGLPNNDLVDGATWNIRLTGGADLGAANAMAVQRPVDLAGKGSVILDGADAKIRTGTGSIAIAAGRDFVITNDAAVVYTSGIAAAPNAPNTVAAPNPAGTVSNPWVKDGGSIRISAQQDAIGTSEQGINEWLRRPRGTVATSRLSGWWANRANFRQNIASFGGGDIEIAAGRNVDNLSAMSPTSGRVTSVDGQQQLDVQGGGDLRVEAGGDVLGGEYLVGRGAGVIRAGGKVGLDKDPGGTLLKNATQVYLMGESDEAALRQASMTIAATGDVAIQSVDNPTILAIPRTSDPGSNTASSYFYTYADDSRVDLTSLAGQIALGSAPLIKPLNGGTDTSGSAYPAALSAVAFGGDIVRLAAQDGGSDLALTLFPSASGSVRLLAERNVSGINLAVSDRDPTTVSAWNRVESAPPETGNLFLATDPTSPRLVTHAATTGYAYDVQARTGSLTDSNFTFPGAARLRAGLDITGLNAVLQNLGLGDLSLVQADSGDVRPTGGIVVGGPGQLLVQAGRNVDLQTPLTATGNAGNASLTTGDSARLTVIAGVSGNLDLAKLDAAYAEVIEAGKAKDDARAQAAMKAFWGAAKIQAGNIDSYLTSIETFGGSAVDLLAPKGNITVGLTTPQERTVGVVTNAGGAIRSVLDGDFNINQGKVVTAQGGDILIYTHDGNIDAGRGAKTSATTPAPRRVPVLDDTGATVGYKFILPSGVAGSGIQTVTSDPDGPGPSKAPAAGAVYLFAPTGFIDAGEAGIVSGGDIFLVAQVVLNASNISAAGASVGVPVAESGSLASSMASGGTTNNAGSKAAEDAANAAGNAAKASAGAMTKPNILTVEVMGFGDKNCKEQDKDCFAK